MVVMPTVMVSRGLKAKRMATATPIAKPTKVLVALTIWVMKAKSGKVGVRALKSSPRRAPGIKAAITPKAEPFKTFIRNDLKDFIIGFPRFHQVYKY